jgi:hypothetical protein
MQEPVKIPQALENGSSNAARDSYDVDALAEPLLSEAELRALLGGDS